MRFYLSLGSNLGDPEAQLRQGVRAIDAIDGVRVDVVSDPFASAAMYVVDQPDFVNLAVAVESDHAPHDMLRALQRVENEHGRERGIRFGPRTLDIDIIAIDDRVIDEPAFDDHILTVPHPRMHERSFVLVPLAQIAPDWTHPVLGVTAIALRDTLLAAPPTHDDDAAALAEVP